MLKEVERVAGQNAYWHYGRAVQFLWNAEDKKKSAAIVDQLLNQALRHLSEAHQSRPSWPAPLASEGRIYDYQGKTDWALKNYMDAVELGEHDPPIIRRALQLLFEKQRYTDANHLVRELEMQQLPFSPDMNRVGAELALQQGEFRRTCRWHEKPPLRDRRTMTTTCG